MKDYILIFILLFVILLVFFIIPFIEKLGYRFFDNIENKYYQKREKDKKPKIENLKDSYKN
ncbi:MAG: hypothetical protein J6M39_00630 [Lachnospiraceae bacterium]|nr:hypothetical protein [Lachnospiraceae bacterium]